MRSLYEITKDYEKLDALLSADTQGEELDAQLVTIMESLEAESGVKLDNYIDYTEHLGMLDRECIRQIDEWSQRRTRIRNKLDLLKQRTIEHMKARGIKKIVSATGRTVTLVPNGGSQPMKLGDPDSVPAEFLKTIQVINSAAVRKALEAGQELPFAKLEERGCHVRFG